MKIAFALIATTLVSFSLTAAPPLYFTAITNGVSFNNLMDQTLAEMQYIADIKAGPCPGCYVFEVGVIYPNDREDSWYFATQLAPTGQIAVTLLPGNPGPHGPHDWEDEEEYEESFEESFEK
jgi:hypothetical protein